MQLLQEIDVMTAVENNKKLPLQNQMSLVHNYGLHFPVELLSFNIFATLKLLST